MKYYFRYPDRALEGMSELNPGQRGIYNSVIDLLYARDGLVPCLTPADDKRIAKNISVPQQTWRKYKAELMALGKIRITNDGLLDANGVADGRKDAENHSVTQRKRVSIRWEKYRLAKKINGRSIPRPVLPIYNDKDNSEYSSPQSMENAKDVDEVENFGAPRPHSTIATGELEAVVRAKGWK